jgi:hypothetical protein
MNGRWLEQPRTWRWQGCARPVCACMSSVVKLTPRRDALHMWMDCVV